MNSRLSVIAATKYILINTCGMCDMGYEIHCFSRESISHITDLTSHIQLRFVFRFRALAFRLFLLFG